MLDPSWTAFLGLIIGGFILTRHFFKRKTDIPIIYFPKERRENFYFIKKEKVL